MDDAAAGRCDRGRPAAGPLRRCIATGEIAERARLLRLVIGPGGELVPDLASGLPGRGLWVTPRRDVVERAITKRLFARAARAPVIVSPGFADRIEGLLAQRCCDAIGLARRAGLAFAGFEKVCEAMRAGKVGLLLSAIDGAEAGRGKVRALGAELPVVRVLTAAEMGGVFGRDHVVHVALSAGRLSRRLLDDAEKMAGFRSGAVVDRGATPAVARRGPGR
ncbi:MAG: RNA-binding protein [Alphaproteobacteria bacterium]|nr:RNA-binding protein [Alphaproteobacteria bacterium]